MADGIQRWRVKIGSDVEITSADLPPGLVSEVTELYCEGTWSVVMTADREHLPALHARALALPGFCVYSVWPHQVQVSGDSSEASHG